MFETSQIHYIDMLTDFDDIERIPIESIGDWIKNIEDVIIDSNLSNECAMPLLLATSCGKKIVEYWLNVVEGNNADWDKFLQTEKLKNYINIPNWVVSCIEGTLVGSKLCSELIEKKTDRKTAEIISSLIGSLTLSAGKVIFKLIPSVTNKHISGGFSTVQLMLNEKLPEVNKMCTNKKKCNINGSNTCVNTTCANTCTNKCNVKPEK